jgi:hypothetical protein
MSDRLDSIRSLHATLTIVLDAVERLAPVLAAWNGKTADPPG